MTLQTNLTIYGFPKTSDPKTSESLAVIQLPQSFVHFEKKDLIATFGIKRKLLDTYLARHKKDTRVRIYDDNGKKRTFIHITILPYLIRFARGITRNVEKPKKMSATEKI